MRGASPVLIMVSGIVALFLMLHERARVIAALIVFVVVLIAAADVFGIDLKFWK